MKALIYKDLVFYKREFVCVLVWLACCLVGDLVLISRWIQMDILQQWGFGFVLISIVACTCNDEINNWSQYSGVLPYSGAQIVSSKYLSALVTILAAAVFKLIFNKLSFIAIGVQLNTYTLSDSYLNGNGLFGINNYELADLVLYLITLLILPAVGLLLTFVNSATAKIGFLFSAICWFWNFKILDKFSLDFMLLCKNKPYVPYLTLLIGIIIFISSWVASVYCFKKRDF